eukprot:4227374-Pleurochrysis_carterae.AAC.1
MRDADRTHPPPPRTGAAGSRSRGSGGRGPAGGLGCEPRPPLALRPVQVTAARRGASGAAE